MMFKYLRSIGLLALSVAIVLLTLALPVDIANQAALADVRMGLPFAFLHQDFSGIDPPSFPWSVMFASPWEFPLSIHWPLFILNILLVFAVLFVIQSLIMRGKKSAKISSP